MPVIRLVCFLLIIALSSTSALAAIEPASERSEGEGPYDRLILRGATLINSTGAPPKGPVDIVIRDNRIEDIHVVGYPGVEIDPEGRPEAGEDDRVLDLEGMYVLPGFVDMHAHIGGAAQGTPADYVFKLWMGHGITTIRDPGSFNGLDWVLEHKEKSGANEITAPRIQAYAGFGMDHDGPITTERQARRWVRGMDRRGADGFKFFGAPPKVLRAAIEEANDRGLGTAQHHAQLEVGRANVLDTARWGLDTMEHWYGLPEALFEDRTLQDYRRDYNYQNEYHRFSEAGKLWKQAAEPGSEHWQAVRDELIELGLTLNPTLTIYEANRDFMAQRRAEWHEYYTLPALWDFFEPDRRAHGSYWFDWSTQDEINWKENYRLWMQFLNDYKNHGGRVTVGSDSGYIYKLYGFGYIQELELLQEAGFHPLEVIRAATLHGAEALGMDDEIGSVEPGKLADLVVVEENPLENFKVLFGTGAIRVDEQNQLKRVGGVRYTIKDGIIFDAEQLRADVRDMVEAAKEEAGVERLKQPASEY
ncbi:cytosine/adenosine deaminase-related metal-dependent hydrolase [Natronospira proteinivora]|uniref:Cytosine/adenosine deaminase-related metal-dependent hydrolase n=1 Tax=Natronospira proteinivora TaxID=1807133 RepID=A0ABT1GCU2_9GAMM|nr:amidohydrolase family protein [Natronospira proteinivora]MCP1727762.1 cytosine/adenosine deaminase-related metal-dependent hydrolase [Natronospira proteinivora]